MGKHSKVIRQRRERNKRELNKEPTQQQLFDRILLQQNNVWDAAEKVKEGLKTLEGYVKTRDDVKVQIVNLLNNLDALDGLVLDHSESVKKKEAYYVQSLKILQDRQTAFSESPLLKKEYSDGTPVLSYKNLMLIFAHIWDPISDKNLHVSRMFRACSVDFRESTRMFMKEQTHYSPLLRIDHECVHLSAYLTHNAKDCVTLHIESQEMHQTCVKNVRDYTMIMCSDCMPTVNSYKDCNVCLVKIKDSESNALMVSFADSRQLMWVGGALDDIYRVQWGRVPLTPVTLDVSMFGVKLYNHRIYMRSVMKLWRSDIMTTMGIRIDKNTIGFPSRLDVECVFDPNTLSLEIPSGWDITPAPYA